MFAFSKDAHLLNETKNGCVLFVAFSLLLLHVLFSHSSFAPRPKSRVHRMGVHKDGTPYTDKKYLPTPIYTKYGSREVGDDLGRLTSKLDRAI